MLRLSSTTNKTSVCKNNPLGSYLIVTQGYPEGRLFSENNVENFESFDMIFISNPESQSAKR